MRKEYCPFRLKNHYKQYICSLSLFYLGKTKICGNISHKTCDEMIKKETGI